MPTALHTRPVPARPAAARSTHAARDLPFDAARLVRLWRRLLRGGMPWLLVLAGLTGGAPATNAQGAANPGSETAWTALEGGGVAVLFRHAQAPGGGDPPGWRLDDCRTQRNLDDAGRAQARRIGDAFRARAIDVASVHHSRWCRTRETAELAFPGRTRDAADFDSFFSAPEREAAQSAAAAVRLTAWLDEAGPRRVVVVVTHQVNITALTGVVPASGEGVVLRWRRGANGPTAFELVGRVTP